MPQRHAIWAGLLVNLVNVQSVIFPKANPADAVIAALWQGEMVAA